MEVMKEMSANMSVVGIFEDRVEAGRAVEELESAGFERSQIGFALRGEDVSEGGMATDVVGTKDARGAIGGLIGGGVAGGMLAGALAAMIPGAGPVMLAGIFTAAFGGMAAGAATGGILGALMGLGLSEREAAYFEREFDRGRAIVAVHGTNRPGDAARILRQHGASIGADAVRTESEMSIQSNRMHL